MAAHRLGPRHLAALLLGLALGLPLSLPLAHALSLRTPAVELHARVAEDGGWLPADLTVAVGEPLRLRLTSDDVVHGFAVGQSDAPALDVEPGRTLETTLTFSRPGKYVFYCTRWCGANHWRMRGTIEVTGPGSPTEPPPSPPLYVRLGLDLDAPHPANPVPQARPSALRGSALSRDLPLSSFQLGDLRTRGPVEVWRQLRVHPSTAGLTDVQVWDVVAFEWRSGTDPASLREGRSLYAANCAACHGETGDGRGVMAASIAVEPATQAALGHAAQKPADFTDAQRMLGASPAVLQGKILRGGMGTGMPYWGPIFTEPQTWALVDYLWSLQFQYEATP